MSVQYEIRITNANGVTLRAFTSFVSLEYNRAENEVGTATVVLPRALFSEGLFQSDNLFEFWRSVDGGPPYLDTETAWFIRDWDRETIGKEKLWTVYAFCLNHLWKRRIVDYNEYNPYTSKGTYLDDMGKAVYRENLGSLVTDSIRNLSALVSVQQNNSAAPSAVRSLARDSVYDVLRDFSKVSWELGTYLTFDTVLTQSTQPRFQFRSYIGQRGIDRRGISQLTFGEQFGNLAQPRVAYRSSDEVTRGIVGGQGVATTQAIARYLSPTRYNASPFNLIEKFENDSRETDAAGLDDTARGVVNRGQPTKTLTGDPLSVPGAIYGRDWNWGDRVRGQDENDTFDCRIPAVTVRVNRDNGEQITAQLSGEITDG